MANAVNISNFYREHGIRNIGQLMTLRQNDMLAFRLPMNSTLHVGVRGIGEIGLPEDDELLANAGNRILAQFRFKYSGATVGAPTVVHRQVLPEVKAFLKRNKNLKWFEHSRSWLNTPTVPYIVNYCSLDTSYRYREREGVGLFRQVNFFNTIIDGIVNELTDTDRNQFMYFDTPETLPPLARMEEAERQLANNAGKELPLDKRTRDVLHSDGHFLLLQLWLWAGANPHLSVLSKIEPSLLDRVLFITSVDGKYSTLNLGTFRSWVRSPENPKGSLSPQRAQRSILRHFMSLQQLGTLSEDTIIVDEQSELDRQNSEVNATVTEQDVKDSVGEDTEYKSERPSDPVLTVDIDANAIQKDKSLNIDTKAKKSTLKDTDAELSDEEDFLFDQMDRDLAQHTASAAQSEVDQIEESENVYRPYEVTPVDFTTKIMDTANDLHSRGLFTAAEVRRANALANRYKDLKSPFDPNQKMEDYIVINEEELVIKDTRLTEKKIKGVLDESMMYSASKDFTTKYIDNVMGRDIMNAVMHFQKGGIALTDVNMVRTDELMGSYYTISAQLTPVVGKPTTVRFSIPVISRDGIFKANGVKYRQKIQRRDAPIRKVGPDLVALTSLMSKIFVKRTPRVRFNYGMWLVNQINLGAMDSTSPIGEVKHSNVYDPTIKLPYSYSSIALEISEFKFGTTSFFFNYSRLEQNFPAEILQALDLTKHVPFAFKQEDGVSKVYVFDGEDMVHLIDLGSNQIQKVGKITQLLNIDRNLEPVNFAEIQILGNDVPAGVMLGYRLGLGNLLRTSKVEFRRVRKGTPTELQPHEFPVIFEDETLIFNRDDQKACLLFNGFNRLKNVIRRMSVYSFDKPDAYASLLKALSIPLDHLKQYSNIFDVWIDHLTHGALVELEEPTDMVLLYLSAIDKLLDNAYKDPNNVTDSVLWGYQRVSGFVYDAMYKAMRTYVKTPQSKSASIDINPREVWFSIIQDQTVAPIEESNPIHAIKEKDVVVFRGKGGRSSDTMTAKHRQFTRDAVGIISEANVDNGQVGTIAYLTADPNITSLRGTCKQVEDLENVPRAKVQSTAMLLSPGSDMDDSKRVTFTNVMFTSTTFLHDSVPNRVLSGGERTVAFRTDDQWARNAKKPGKVINIAGDIITVEYDDGEIESFSIGRYFGTWSGNIIPHQIDTTLKVGDIFNKDDILAYNSYYFEPDNINPKHVIFKRGIRGNVLFWEARDTLEDANSISIGFSQRLSTSATEKRYVTIPADHDVEVLVKAGTVVDPESILCTLRPPLSGLSQRYSQEALDALDALNTLTPKAKYDGVIERVELMYTGELDAMSESLQEIVSEYDAKLYRNNRKLDNPVKTAKIDPSYSIKGRDVGADQVVMVFYVTKLFGAAIGDKLVLGNQMKTIISNVVDQPYVAEDGTVVDVSFSRQGISNRIVNSMDLQGTSNTFLSLVEKEMIEAFQNADFTNK